MNMARSSTRPRCWPETIWPDGRITQVRCDDGKLYAVESHEWFW